ncbi:hypothetical protein GW17_00010417 [Ensete ventricosum]|nr:hypothetical protein GW17_00010417 [Ensete ventricosum]
MRLEKVGFWPWRKGFRQLKWSAGLFAPPASLSQSREATPRACKRAAGVGAAVPCGLLERAAGGGTRGPRGVEAAPEELTHGGDEVLRGVDGRRRGAEAFGEDGMAAERLLRGDPALGATNLVLDGFAAETANPPAAVPLPYLCDVRRGALFPQSAARAGGPHQLRLRIPRGGRHRLTAPHLRRHRQSPKIDLSGPINFKPHRAIAPSPTRCRHLAIPSPPRPRPSPCKPETFLDRSPSPSMQRTPYRPCKIWRLPQWIPRGPTMDPLGASQYCPRLPAELALTTMRLPLTVVRNSNVPIPCAE